MRAVAESKEVQEALAVCAGWDARADANLAHARAGLQRCLEATEECHHRDDVRACLADLARCQVLSDESRHLRETIEHLRLAG